MPGYRDPAWGGPPAPLVDVQFEWQGRREVVTGILDTGADFTQLPQTVVRALQLTPVGDITITDANGNRQPRYIYLANVTFEGLDFPTTPVIGSDLPVVLVGRDILNALRATFDGPATTFTLHR